MPIMTLTLPKGDPGVKKNAFVHKLYSMLSNPKLAHLIWWTETPEANTFALYPSKEFADALSGYFKHGNVASFVRQLHMYGFHKVLEPQSSVQNVKDSPIWEFRHSSGKFKKNDEKSLVYIKRRLLLNLLRNLVVESDQNRPTSTPLPVAYETYQPQQPYPSSVAVPPVQGVQGVYVPVHYTNHYNYKEQIPGPNNRATTTVASASSLSASGPPSSAATSAGAKLSGSHNASRAHPTPLTHSPHTMHLPPLHHIHHAPAYATPYHPQGMMLPPPPPDRVCQVLWQQGAPVYAQFYPVSSTLEPLRSQEDSPLNFRKPWELLVERPRNPSLLYDPLAPVSNDTQNSASVTSLVSENNSPRPDVIKLPPLGRPALPSPKNLTKPSAPKATSSIPLVRTLPQSSLQRALVPHFPLASLQWQTKPSLIPISKSAFDKLRPSLIELHFPHGNSGTVSAPGSISGKPAGLSDSIGSHSLSVFSGMSSILSNSSGRSSSFGSVSHIIVSEKNNSIGPHEQNPVSPQVLSRVSTIKEESNLVPKLELRSDSETPADGTKPSTPLHKAKVEYLLETPEPKQESDLKRQRIETLQSS